MRSGLTLMMHQLRENINLSLILIFLTKLFTERVFGGYIVPEQVYKLFLLNPDAVLSSTEATLSRANGVGVTFAALLIVLLGGEEENARQINIVRYVGGLLLIGFAVFTNFNGFLIFGVTEIALALYTGRQLRPSTGSESYTPNTED